MAKCVYPITIGSNDGKRKYKVVPCGKCTPCRRRRQAQWSFRLSQEMQRSTSAAFLTLTYDDYHLPRIDEYVEGYEYLIGKPTLNKRDIQLFIKRLRKKQKKITNDKIKYYAVGEYGGITKRPHYHFIAFNIAPSLLFENPIDDIWQKGNSQVDECNIRTIQYVTKYVMKSLGKPFKVGQAEFSMMSKRLGDNFLTNARVRHYRELERPYIVWEDGKKHSMPRYYKEKIWHDNTELLRKFGKEALKQVEPQTLDSTKVFEIEQMNLKLKRLQNDKRSKI